MIALAGLLFVVAVLCPATAFVAYWPGYRRGMRRLRSAREVRASHGFPPLTNAEQEKNLAWNLRRDPSEKEGTPR